MEKEFVPYELAVRLKRLGFDEPCFFAFDNCSTPMRCSDLRTNEQKFNGVNYNSSTYTSQPTFSQVFRWFREKYQLFYTIETNCSQLSFEWGFDYTIFDKENDKWLSTEPQNCPPGETTYVTYEEAESACIDKLIDIIKV